MGSFCQRYLFVYSQESTNSGRSRIDLQNLPIFNWSPQVDRVTSNFSWKKEEKKRRIVRKWWKRKDGVEELK
jgi:hypothetical protein